MKFPVLFLAAFLLYSCGAAPVKPDYTRDEGRYFFWKAVKDEATVYLLGSIHAGKKKTFPLAPVIEKAFNRSQVLAVELDITDPDLLDEVKDIVKKEGFYSDDDSLTNHLPERVLDKLESFQKKKWLILPRASLYRMKPWLAAMTVSQYKSSGRGFDAKYGVDRYLIGKCQDRDDMKLVSLETARYQMSVFTGMSRDMQLAYLESTLDDKPDSSDNIETLYNIWQSGDYDTMVRFIREFSRQYPDVYARLFDIRNTNMAERITEIASPGEVLFVVVGAGHMVGPTGVPQLLRERGFEVTRY